MASAVNSLFGGFSAAAATGGNSTNANSAGSPTPSEGVFLTLLVSQIQNQDPLNPSDSTQFVTQLAQFSQLEQVIAIRGDIENGINSASSSSAASSGTASQSSAPAQDPSASQTAASTQTTNPKTGN